MSTGIQAFFTWVEPIFFLFLPAFLGFFVPDKFYLPNFYPAESDEIAANAEISKQENLKYFTLIGGNPGILFFGHAYATLLCVMGIAELMIFYGGDIVSMNALCIAFGIGDILHFISATKYFFKKAEAYNKTGIKQYLSKYLIHIGPTAILFALRIAFVVINWQKIAPTKI